jgi:3-hydroxymyristoyl/3-hydroxydecanoyl-(acyl carrier protein) dehydratase
VPTANFTIPSRHPSLAGHFPGRPIVPGVILLDQVLALISGAPTGCVRLESAKFMAPVLPEREVAVEWTVLLGGEANFTCRVGGRVVLRGRASMPRPSQ